MNKEKILLHSCCAPCASYPIEKLKQDGFEPVVYFYNPNIYPIDEYNIRKNELQNYCEKLNIEFFIGEYEKDLFYENVKGLEKCEEKGERCAKCFHLRLLNSANFAKNLKIKYFTTTLTISPHKDSSQIFNQGKIVQEQTGVKFLEYNFKKEDGFKISRQIAKENNMYFQKYCGCIFSIRN